MNLQLHIFRLQHSTKRICAAIGDMSTIQCALYCIYCAKYSAHPPVYSIWTVVPDIYNVITVPNILASIFNWTCLRWYWRYVDNAMRVTLQTWCQMQRTPSSLRYVYCGRDIYNVTTVPHIQATIFNWTYLRRYWRYLENSMSVTLQIWCQIQCTSSSSRYVNYRRGHIQCIYSSANWGFNIQRNISALLLDICRHFGARCTANLVTNTAHIPQFMLRELWSWTYTISL
jgi:hypothetical protein